eukprot:jgi/Mesvir1/13781/Mv15950-RA.1
MIFLRRKVYACLSCTCFAQVAVLDYVDPSPQGTSWGLGGTCVNVGCIPKKLFHQAGLLGESLSDARSLGWKIEETPQHEWETMVTSVQNYIGSLNWGYKVQLRDSKVTYLNAKGKFVGPNTLACTDRKGKTTNITSRRFVIAVGGRPKYPDVPGAKECCITSDDIFALPSAPGKTLVVGASYIALECAGFLHALGYDTTVMVRSIFLRGFDQEIADKIASHMEAHGVSMVRQCVPTKFVKLASGEVEVTYKNLDFDFESTATYQTVLLAVGREPCTADLGLDAAGVPTAPDGKLDVHHEQTAVPHIYALGDVLRSRQELTPVAIKAGVFLARRLYNGEQQFMEYNEIPTTVFTPLEYGCVGLSEEDAIAKYGADNIEVYHSYFKPLEWATNHEALPSGVPHREDNACFCKLVCLLPDNERVLGLHYLGPNAGEVTQGYAVAIKLRATKADFERTVGIHPTTAEEFTTMRITKRSGQSAQKSGC